MVKVVVEGQLFEAKGVHDIDVMSFFPEGKGSVNGMVKCLLYAFDDEKFASMLEKMTVSEIISVWQEWAAQSNSDLVYGIRNKSSAIGKSKTLKWVKFFVVSWVVMLVAHIIVGIALWSNVVGMLFN